MPKCRSMPCGDCEEFAEESRRDGAAADCEEIDQLDEQASFAAARFAHYTDELPQSRQKSIMSGTQQWAARHVSDTRRLDDDCARPAAREALVPFQHFGRDETFFTGPPWHHGGHPG